MYVEHVALMWLIVNFLCVGFVSAQEKFEGGVIQPPERLLKAWDSPFYITEDIIVMEDAELVIEPGVQMIFSPKTMLAVNGTLTAKGTPQNPILMTADIGQSNPEPNWPEEIRLVDDRSVTYGRLQVLYQGKWRGICANSINWTEADTTVACRQLGFSHGNFSFLSWATNDSAFMLYHKPSCYGDEQNILNCPGAANIKIGSRICKHQQTIHLDCYGLSPNSPAHNYWWGLEFYNSSITLVRDIPNLISINESSSTLSNVIIEYSGVDPTGQPIPAVRASPYVPHLINVTLRHCALDAINFTDVLSSTLIKNSVIMNNRGHGVAVETHLGRVSILDSNIVNNRGNGIKTKYLMGNFLVLNEDQTFCKRGSNSIGNPDYMPIIITAIPIQSVPNPFCEKKFETKIGHRVTLTVLEMDIEPSSDGWLNVYDFYRADASKLIASYKIINGTMPQGVTSSLEYMYITFNWTYPPGYDNGNCETLKDCVKVTFLVDAAEYSKDEFFINNTFVSNNTQHGMFVENIRNFIHVNASEITNNKYGAGLRVFGGAGDIQVNASQLEHNQDNGINITYDGGWRIFNVSSFSYNFGNGINITLNETSIDNKTRYAKHQRTEVSRSQFEFNDGFGVRVGNCCRPGKVVVNDSLFIQNNWDGIEVESCFRVVPTTNVTNFTLTNNTFDGNYGHGVRVNPMINMVGIMTNNTFINHPRHAFLIDNTDDFLKEVMFRDMKVDYQVIENDFMYNEGFYVIHVRLTESSKQQKLDFKYNRIRFNRIKGGFPTINERTRAYGVAVLSSSNVNFSRNHLENPESRYELTTHLLDKSARVEATRLWWGTTNYTLMSNHVFDQYSRYDLPMINYYPSLNSDYLYGEWLNDQVPPYEPPFLRAGNTIGGRLTYKFTTQPGQTYHVDRDINIVAEAANGELHLSEGTILETENSIGILVQGLLMTYGSEERPVILRLSNESTYTNSSLVRLVDGPNEFEGRLEVLPEGSAEWGTVCNEGWNIQSASVACQMMGWVVYPDDWGFYEATAGEPWQPIWRSSVRCTELDIDLTRCEADGPDDHSCNHTQDVYLKCKKPTWGGIHFLSNARSSKVSHVIITECGLKDPTVFTYAPGILIDYNTHTMEYLQVTENVHDGIEIMKNAVYANAALRHSLVSNNQGNGVSTRGSFFELFNCTLSSNKKSGFEYNPHYTTYEARQLRSGIHGAVYLDQMDSLHLGPEVRQFVLTSILFTNETKRYIMEIFVDNEYRVVMDMIDYTPLIEIENVTVFDSRKDNIDNPGTQFWKIEDDLPDFPVESQSQYLTVAWDVRGVSSGRFSFVVRSKHYTWRWPFAELRVRNTTTRDNERGIVTRHYNQPSDEYLDLFFRYRWETIQMYGITFINNTYEALHVPSITKYNELYLPTYEELQNAFKMCEITYEVDSCYITQNGGGVLGEHNHVEFSNNVWIWQVTNNHFEYNRGGGFNIELPLVNLMSSELYNHSVDINDTVFEYNQNFEFHIDGFYCNSSIARNRFQGNLCKSGCVTISGTEKDFEMHDNEFFENQGKYIFEINIDSHTPYTRWVDAQIMYNNFKRNRKLDDGTGDQVSSTPTTYTMGIKGLQNITINRNLFSNYLDFELVGGYSSSSLENYLDVTQNWWGTDNQVQIQTDIFDFDDWNSYAIAEYYPHLVGDYFDAPTSSEGKYIPVFDPTQPLGGRITGNLRLPTRAEPYIVNRDLTIMPTGSLVIEKDVEIQFFPNVGILVLGSMSALGNEDQRIRFTPIKKTDYQNNTLQRIKRSVDTDNQLNGITADIADSPLKVRLNGGDNEDEGFIEIYNETERRWALLCDSNFNDRTAEVACKTMGKESSNAIVRRSTLYDYYVFGYPKMHEQLVEWFWRETFICDGTEPSLEKCRYKINYNLVTCMEAREYVFMRCGPRNLAPEYEYWGNVRFSVAEYEVGDIMPSFSLLDHVDIYGAGILHGEKSAAVQAVYRSPSTEYVRITHSNQNGYDYIAPNGEFQVMRNEISINNGYGFGGLILNGDSNYENTQASFYPLEESTIPYNVFGLVRMCTSEKLIYVKRRLLVYYKYDFEAIDCLKIFRSREPNHRIAFRLLQFKMYDDRFYENALELYNGEYFSQDMMIVKLNATTNADLVAKRKPYATLEGYDTMGIRITASAAYGDHGFIADIVTLPYSGGDLPNFGPGLRQHITESVITHNEGGGFHFSNVGEDNPAVIIEMNRIQWNGLRMLNLTSGNIVDMFVQNAKLATIANNYIVDNAGGLQVKSTTTSSSNSVYFNITNNIINYNTHGEPLHVEGHHFNKFEVQNNYLAYNDVGDRSVVSMFGVRLNYTTNVIYNNTGQCILNASVPEQIDINQVYRRNSFYDNQAYSANKSTVFLKSAKFLFENNYFQNPYNIFELVTFNRTKYPDGTYPEVKAEYNWWGGGSDAFVAGRIWDRKDDDNLIGVTYLPPHQTNQSVVQGRCYPGWQLMADKCYLYFGGVISYREAELECKANRARLGWARDKNYERMFGEIISSMQMNYNEFWKTWAYSEWGREGKCTVLQNYQIEHINCDENLPFICERDPYINPTIYWWPIQVAIGCAGATLFVAVIFVVFGFVKARQRKYERLQRRTEVRKSIHGSKASVYSNRGARSTAMTGSYSSRKKQRTPLSASADFINLSGVTLDDSADVMENPKMDFHRPSTPHTLLDNSGSRLDQSSYFDSDLGPVTSNIDRYGVPRVENEIRSVEPRRFDNFDNTAYYRNEAYDDYKSIDVPYARSASSVSSPLHHLAPYEMPSTSYSPTPSSHNQSLAYSEGNLARNIHEKPPRPRPKESAM